jgi:hypothetical protein
MLMCTHPCSTHQTLLSQVVRVATTAQEKMKPWSKTSRSSKITTSFRRGLTATPSRLPMKAVCIYVSFFTLWSLLKTMWMPHTYDVIDYYFPFYIIIWALCDDVQLCNCCVCELLILARTWFAFSLPSKTGCDNYEFVEVVHEHTIHQVHKENLCICRSEWLVCVLIRDAWKALDTFDPDFTAKPRNVWIRLMTDGFTPVNWHHRTHVTHLFYSIQPSTFTLYEVWIYVSLLDYTLLGPFWKETQCHVTTLDWRVEGALERSQSIWCFQKVEIQTLSRIFVVGPWLPNVRYFSSWSLHGKLTCSYCSSNTNCFCLAFGRNITSIVIDGCCPGNTTLEAIRKAS